MAQLTADSSGNFYGTTVNGGRYGAGSVFELSPNGSGRYTENVLYSFCSESGCTDGNMQCSTFGGPYQQNYLTFDTAGNLYGTTCGGGANGFGTAFELSPSTTGWTETVLYDFCSQSDCTDGANPCNGLIWDPHGNLYGTTYGAWPTGLQGSVYELSPDGNGGWTEEVIYAVTMGWAGLTMDRSGNIYGVAADYDNFAFKLAPPTAEGGSWTPTTIHTFTGSPDGRTPESAPVVDSVGNLYGTTEHGGSTDNGVVYKLIPVTTGRDKGTYKEKILYNFLDSNTSGAQPWGSPILDSSGNLYGTTQLGGKYSDGTIWELAVDGAGYKAKLLWIFNGPNGEYPFDSVILVGDNLYGTTEVGGTNGAGAVFEVVP